MATGHDRVRRGLPRIVLNATALTEGGSGVQTYERELLAALGADIDAIPATLCAIVDRAAAHLVPSGIERRVVHADTGVRRKLIGARSIRDAELVHGLDVDIPLSRQRSSQLARVATIHDLAQLDTPWAFGGRGLVKRWLTRVACRRADQLIAVSAFTAERIQVHFGREAIVVPEAPRRSFQPPSRAAVDAARAAYALPDPCVLYVGNIEPRKDVPTLVDACRLANVPLAVTGGAIDTVQLPSDVLRLGYVAEADLPALFCAATIVAYVSRYEGFGLPPIEALACGATVVATPTGALRDVAPEGIEFVPIGDAVAQAEGLRNLLHDADRREARRDAARHEIAALSWERTARETAAVWFGVLGR
jgi:glycosyltransferase involved in cell wall biosynthesis